jgi:hypothetical protein
VSWAREVALSIVGSLSLASESVRSPVAVCVVLVKPGAAAAGVLVAGAEILETGLALLASGATGVEEAPRLVAAEPAAAGAAATVAAGRGDVVSIAHPEWVSPVGAGRKAGRAFDATGCSMALGTKFSRQAACARPPGPRLSRAGDCSPELDWPSLIISTSSLVLCWSFRLGSANIGLLRRCPS